MSIQNGSKKRSQKPKKVELKGTPQRSDNNDPDKSTPTTSDVPQSNSPPTKPTPTKRTDGESMDSIPENNGQGAASASAAPMPRGAAGAAGRRACDHEGVLLRGAARGVRRPWDGLKSNRENLS